MVVVLLAFAFGSGWLFKNHLEIEREQYRGRINAVLADRTAAQAELLQKALPSANAPAAQQAQALQEWSQRLHWPMELLDAQGGSIAITESFQRRTAEMPSLPVVLVPMSDGRSLRLIRPGMRHTDGADAPVRPAPRNGRLMPPGFLPMALNSGAGLAVLLLALFVAVALGAFPVVRRLTRKLEALRSGVEQFGAGNLSQRVDASGRDEVAQVAQSFNLAAQRIESLVHSHQSLLANTSHELRSPLARLKMAIAMLADANPAQRNNLNREISKNIAELDALVEEVLLASRLEARSPMQQDEGLDLLAIAAEEASRIKAELDCEGVLAPVNGDERLLRRAIRNLLENAQRYGGQDVQLHLTQTEHETTLRVNDQGQGVPAEMRERIFEPFFRLPGHAEHAGGVGLGLSLVKQIAERHRGRVYCEPREGGGSSFVLKLPR